MRKTICIISFSPIARDARVMRQIQYLSRQYDLVVVGFGPPHGDWVEQPAVRWITIQRHEPPLLKRLGDLFLAGPARLHEHFYDLWYWAHPWHRQAFAAALAAPRPHAIHANDLLAAPVAARLAALTGARLVVDLHEYAPLEFEESLPWRLVYPPMIRSLLQRYVRQAAATVTVVPEIADRYRDEFGFEPMVVLNAPERTTAPSHVPSRGVVRMIHHGAAIRSRRLEAMIEILARCDLRYTLDFMLVGDSTYVHELQQLAERLAPGRVSFCEPVSPEAIVSRIATYDIGLCYIYPSSYNYRMSLPNKLFDFVGAGLAVCVGPSPAMAALVREYGFGAVAPSFAPSDVAVTLNSLSHNMIVEMRAAARAAAARLNADVEMTKMFELYRRLLAA